jgi:hypothetical protein
MSWCLDLRLIRELHPALPGKRHSEPADANAYQRDVESAIIRLAKATGGRMLALFTSYAQLKRTSQAISPALADSEIRSMNKVKAHPPIHCLKPSVKPTRQSCWVPEPSGRCRHTRRGAFGFGDRKASLRRPIRPGHRRPL